MFWPKNSGIFQKLYFLVLMSLIAYPIIDYILRNVLLIPIFSSLWDELLIVTGLVLTGFRILFGSPSRSTKISKLIFVLILTGLALTVLDLNTFSINLEGFRAVFQYMFVFFIAFYLIDTHKQTTALLNIAVIIGTLLALHGIYQYIAQVPMPGRWVDSGETVTTRAFSIIGSPNALGSHMAMLIPVSFGLFMQEKSWTRKVFWLTAAAAMGLCLIFTSSRGAWLALAGAIGIMGVLYDRRILIAGILISVLAVLFVPTVNQRITYLFSAEYMMKSSQSGRISRWLDAYDQMRNTPLFGAGLGHFGGAVAQRHFSTHYTDNYYMKTLAEMGLLGLTLFVWLIFNTLREGYKKIKKSLIEYKYIAVGMFGGLLAVALHNGVENIFEIPYLNIYFWLTAGLLMALPTAPLQERGVNDD